VTPDVRHMTSGYQSFFLEGARAATAAAATSQPPPPPPPLHPLIAYSVNRYTSVWCFRYTLISVLIVKHNRYFFKFSFDCVHSLITNLARYDKQTSAPGNQRHYGADTADGGRCEPAYVAIITSPAATAIAARHHHCVHYHYRVSLQVYSAIGSTPTSAAAPTAV